MRAVLGLWRRELIEHRGAFFFAPLAGLAILVVTLLAALLRAGFRLPPDLMLLSINRYYEDAVMIGCILWWAYFAVALFFYYADAFSADRRNNAMLFWKSMPVSDFGILLSKLTVGMVAFCVLSLIFMAITGALLGGLVYIALAINPELGPIPLDGIVQSFGTLMLQAAALVGLSILWYVPFLAWVGALSTVVRRWSIPLAVMTPGLLSGIEFTVFRSGHIGTFFQHRLSFGLDWQIFLALFYQLVPVDGPGVVTMVTTGIDWIMLIGGLVVAIVLVFLASEYRRRRIDT